LRLSPTLRPFVSDLCGSLHVISAVVLEQACNEFVVAELLLLCGIGVESASEERDTASVPLQGALLPRGRG